MKGKFFSRFKDYNYILDKMLEEKRFSQDAKNLLLNMIYKIETSYKDYSMIKGVYKTKNEFIDEIINSVSENCNNILLIDPKREGVLLLQKEKAIAITDEKEKKIYAYPTEQAILYGIMEIKPKYFFIPQKYSYFQKGLQKALVEGSVLNSTEVIRNFNGWSWNVVEDANINHVSNMIYQSIRLLLDEDFLENWEEDKDATTDYIHELRKEIAQIYGETCSKNLYISLVRLIISTLSSSTKKRLEQEYITAQQTYEKMLNKNQYIYDISKEKEFIAGEIEKIDLILSDQNRLLHEFKKQNQQLPEEQKMADASDLFKILVRNKQKYTLRINELNDMVKPIAFNTLKKDLKEKIEILSILEQKEATRTYEILFLQEVLKCFSTILEKIKLKEELLEIIYKMRYFRMMRITQDEKAEDIHILNNYIRRILEFTVTKACREKAFNIFCKDVRMNFLIIERALDTTIANYEDVDISLRIRDDGLEVTVYDNEVIEKQELITCIISSKDLNVKQKKHIPMYVF